MEDYSFEDELECLKSSYDSSEFNYRMLNNSHLLKFCLLNSTSITFEVPSTYPENPPSISITTTELTNAERSEVENELRHFADKSTSHPMVMDLVIKFQQLMGDYHKRKVNTCEKHRTETKKGKRKRGRPRTKWMDRIEEWLKDLGVNRWKTLASNRSRWCKLTETALAAIYTTVVLIDHMRQKKKYSDTLSSWAAEMQIAGFLLFYKRWIFLLLQSLKKNVKDFIIRHKSVCIDVDSSGKRCKEKMSTILYEGISSENFTEFSVKEVTSLEEMEICFTKSQTMNLFQDIIKPIISKNKRDLYC